MLFENECSSGFYHAFCYLFSFLSSRNRLTVLLPTFLFLFSLCISLSSLWILYIVTTTKVEKCHEPAEVTEKPILLGAKVVE